MDSFSRLIAFFFLLLPFSASAQFIFTLSNWSGSGDTVHAAANAFVASYDASPQVQCQLAGGAFAYRKLELTSVAGTTATFRQYFVATSACSASYNQLFTLTASGNPVTCPSGQTRDPATNSCLCDYDRQVGTQFVSGDTNSACLGTCTIYLVSGWYDKTANITWGKSWIQNGASCSASDKPVVGSSEAYPQSASKCDAGTCPGTVNGQSVCVACSSSRENTKTKDSSTEVSTPASGASSATSSTSSGSSTTKCEGDKCTTTTTTTTTNPDGSKTDKTSTKEQPKSDFCTDNPRSAICKEGGTWGGSCGAFSCDGDAVTCAIAQASWKSACALDIEPTDSKVQAGNTALSGGDRPAGHPGNNPSSSLFTANLDQTNPYGSTCPADIPLNVMGNVVSIPLSSACDTFKFMGQVAVAFTLLAAAFVIFGGVKG